MSVPPDSGPSLIHIAVVDDNTLYRDWLGVSGTLLPHHHVVYRARDAEHLVDALPHLPDRRCDVVVLDLRILPTSAPDPVHGGPQPAPVVQGRHAVELILTSAQQCVAEGQLARPPAILVHTQELAPRVHLDCLLAGASGVIAKGEPMERLGEAIDAVAGGGLIVNPALAGLIELLAERRRQDLTEAQAAVLALTTHGLSRHEIAGQLDISESTVDKHLRAIRDTFGDTANLTDLADNFGLRDLSDPTTEALPRRRQLLRSLAERLRPQ